MVVPAALSAERLPAPSGRRGATRTPRASLALSLALHGLAVVLLFTAGASGSASIHEPALMVEVSFAAAAAVEAVEEAAEVMAPTAEPTPAPAKPMPEPQRAIELAPAEEPPPVEFTRPKPIELAPAEEPPPVEFARPEPIELTPADEPPPPDFSELKKIEIAPSQEPPPVKLAELKPAEPPKPPKPAPPAARPEQARPAPKAAAPRAQPNRALGNPAEAQVAAAGFLPTPIVFEGKPRFRHPPTPAAYPQRAIELNQQGEVLVRVRLDPNGTAVEIVLHRSCGYQLLDGAALAAVRSWHFHPAVRDGRPVAAWVEIPVRFHLR